ncbi:phosphotransferase family protein [Microbispora sp. CA-102843]|uniref:phosphotransferase family protein n=1 Tax=Microbispora sp. CA-102843 TaxID=3239952 RepID=UPI003D8A169A
MHELKRLARNAAELMTLSAELQAGKLDSPARSDQGTLAELREELDLLRAELHGWSGPAQAVHGDAHAGNLLAVPDGLLWIDFEETCFGPTGWDLACLLGSGGFQGRQRRVKSACSVASRSASLTLDRGGQKLERQIDALTSADARG